MTGPSSPILSLQNLVRSFQLSTVIFLHCTEREKAQVEYNFTSLIESRERSALPITLDLPPVEWLQIPYNSKSGAAKDFPTWVAKLIVRILAAVVEGFGARTKGATPTALNYHYSGGNSRMYNERVILHTNKAAILSKMDSGHDPGVVDYAIH